MDYEDIGPQAPPAMVVSAASEAHTHTENQLEAAVPFPDDAGSQLYMDNAYFYYMVTAKLALLIWDFAGLLINGLGIDLIWHGIEVNHAVYSLVFQDIVLCWCSSALWLAGNWLWWPTSETWMFMNLIFSVLPLAFHDCAWATIAYLRYVNVTSNDVWLELDQKDLKSKTAKWTWAATAVHLVSLVAMGRSMPRQKLSECRLSNNFAQFSRLLAGARVILFSKPDH